MLTFQLITETGSKAGAIPTEQLPALRSALQEVRDELADRVSARYVYEREAAYTRAIIALGTLAAALNALVPEGDPQFGPRSQMWPDEDKMHAEAAK